LVALGSASASGTRSSSAGDGRLAIALLVRVRSLVRSASGVLRLGLAGATLLATSGLSFLGETTLVGSGLTLGVRSLARSTSRLGRSVLLSSVGGGGLLGGRLTLRAGSLAGVRLTLGLVVRAGSRLRLAAALLATLGLGFLGETTLLG